MTFLEKRKKYFKIFVAILKSLVYNNHCCGMIAMKFEVTTHGGREFGGANVKLGN